jgi:hypothetical protein
MISRRPKRQESTENAPGPRRPIAAAMMTTKNVDSQESDKINMGAGIQENAMPMLAKPTRNPAIGVRSPMKRKAPIVTSSKLVPKIPGVPAPHTARDTPP